MAKSTPEERTARLAKRLEDAQVTAAAGLAPGHLGRAVAEMLQRQDSITRDDLVAHFRAIIDEGGRLRLGVLEAEAVIALLMAPADPPGTSAPRRR